MTAPVSSSTRSSGAGAPDPSTSPRENVKAAIRRAAGAAQGDFQFLLKVASRESSLDAGARAKTSSASGLFQFLEQTWLEAVKKHGESAGLGDEAAQISRDGGRYDVASAEERARILDLRFDPGAATRIAAATFRDIGSALGARIGRAPESGELYMAHFLGPTGAARMIKAPPTAAAADVDPAAAAANAPLFFDADGPVSVKAFRERITSAFDGGAPERVEPNRPDAVEKPSEKTATAMAARPGRAREVFQRSQVPDAFELPTVILRAIFDLDAARSIDFDSNDTSADQRR